MRLLPSPRAERMLLPMTFFFPATLLLSPLLVPTKPSAAAPVPAATTSGHDRLWSYPLLVGPVPAWPGNALASKMPGIAGLLVVAVAGQPTALA